MPIAIGDMVERAYTSQREARQARLADVLKKSRERDLEERRQRDRRYAQARLGGGEGRAGRFRRRSRDTLRVVACLLMVPGSVTVMTGMAVCLCAMSPAIGGNTVFWAQRAKYRIVGPFILAGGCLISLLTYVLYKWTRTGQHRMPKVEAPYSGSDAPTSSSGRTATGTGSCNRKSSFMSSANSSSFVEATELDTFIDGNSSGNTSNNLDSGGYMLRERILGNLDPYGNVKYTPLNGNIYYNDRGHPYFYSNRGSPNNLSPMNSPRPGARGRRHNSLPKSSNTQDAIDGYHQPAIPLQSTLRPAASTFHDPTFEVMSQQDDDDLGDNVTNGASHSCSSQRRLLSRSFDKNETTAGIDPVEWQPVFFHDPFVMTQSRGDIGNVPSPRSTSDGGRSPVVAHEMPQHHQNPRAATTHGMRVVLQTDNSPRGFRRAFLLEEEQEEERGSEEDNFRITGSEDREVHTPENIQRCLELSERSRSEDDTPSTMDAEPLLSKEPDSETRQFKMRGLQQGNGPLLCGASPDTSPQSPQTRACSIGKLPVGFEHRMGNSSRTETLLPNYHYSTDGVGEVAPPAYSDKFIYPLPDNMTVERTTQQLDSLSAMLENVLGDALQDMERESHIRRACYNECNSSDSLTQSVNARERFGSQTDSGNAVGNVSSSNGKRSRSSSVSKVVSSNPSPKISRTQESYASSGKRQSIAIDRARSLEPDKSYSSGPPRCNECTPVLKRRSVDSGHFRSSASCPSVADLIKPEDLAQEGLAKRASACVLQDKDEEDGNHSYEAAMEAILTSLQSHHEGRRKGSNTDSTQNPIPLPLTATPCGSMAPMLRHISSAGRFHNRDSSHSLYLRPLNLTIGGHCRTGNSQHRYQAVDTEDIPSDDEKTSYRQEKSDIIHLPLKAKFYLQDEENDWDNPHSTDNTRMGYPTDISKPGNYTATVVNEHGVTTKVFNHSLLKPIQPHTSTKREEIQTKVTTV